VTCGAVGIADPDEHDGHLFRHWLEQGERGITEYEDDIGREREHLRYSRSHLFRSAAPPAHVSADVAVPGPAQLFKPLEKCGDIGLAVLRRRDSHQDRDPAQFILLRAQRQRPGGSHSRKKCDESAPLHASPLDCG
jgi:hypothetical protein